jgi:hypothetical protein
MRYRIILISTITNKTTIKKHIKFYKFILGYKIFTQTLCKFIFQGFNILQLTIFILLKKQIYDILNYYIIITSNKMKLSKSRLKSIFVEKVKYLIYRENTLQCRGNLSRYLNYFS